MKLEPEALDVDVARFETSAVAACNVDEVVVSGGGSCSTWILGSAPSGNGWSVRCQGSTAAATAKALCIRK